MTTTRNKVHLDATNLNGNVFAIMGAVKNALWKQGQADSAQEYMDRVKACDSYDEALRISMEYADFHFS